MAISLHVGKSVIVSFVVRMSDGSVNTTTTATVSSNLSGVKATMDPSNNRQYAITGVSAAGPASVTLACGGLQTTTFVTAIAPTISGLELGTPSDEVDPPSWA